MKTEQNKKKMKIDQNKDKNCKQNPDFVLRLVDVEEGRELKLNSNNCNTSQCDMGTKSSSVGSKSKENMVKKESCEDRMTQIDDKDDKDEHKSSFCSQNCFQNEE